MYLQGSTQTQFRTKFPTYRDDRIGEGDGDRNSDILSTFQRREGGKGQRWLYALVQIM
jgi:hypothetical protein